MKKYMKGDKKLKALVLTLIVALIALGGVSITSFADQGAKSKDVNDGIKTTSKTAANDETVYLLTDADGREHQRIVSEKGTLHYDGYENDNLPVTMKISYTLDGKAITPENLAGKDGRVVMHINYTNHQKSGSVYVPFMAVTGMILDNEYFSNIKVINGKTVDDGNRNIVVGYSFPGMQESLGLSKSQLDVPESITVSADVKNFQIETIYTFLTSDVFAEMNIDQNADLSDLSGQLDKLKDGASELIKGTTQLYDGTQKLQDGAKKLTAGTDTLKTGTEDLYAGTKDLKSGAAKLTTGTNNLKTGADTLYNGTTQLKTGASDLSNGLTQISASSASINNGAKQVVESVLQTASSSLQAAGMNVTLTAENYTQVLNQAIAASQGDMAKQLTGVKAEIDNVMTFYKGVLTYTAGVDSAAQGAKQLPGSVDALAAGAKQISDGASALKTGQTQLAAGIDKLNGGAEQLFEGTSQLRSKENELVSGINQLNAGAKKLSEGVDQMAKEGLAKLAKLSDGDLAGVFDKINALENAAKSYKAFGSKGNYDTVKFIFKADAISPK
ncbi:X-X-X-Leu-X-X-Gly heptad repeats [uncultured Eubacterium sp.]|nr:X-X-X-Leu-X-X-Gly heptad repeats [uncultured Eubacterium sp.]